MAWASILRQAQYRLAQPNKLPTVVWFFCIFCGYSMNSLKKCCRSNWVLYPTETTNITKLNQKHLFLNIDIKF